MKKPAKKPVQRPRASLVGVVGAVTVSVRRRRGQFAVVLRGPDRALVPEVYLDPARARTVAMRYVAMLEAAARPAPGAVLPAAKPPAPPARPRVAIGDRVRNAFGRTGVVLSYRATGCTDDVTVRWDLVDGQTRHDEFLTRAQSLTRLG